MESVGAEELRNLPTQQGTPTPEYFQHMHLIECLFVKPCQKNTWADEETERSRG